MARTKNKKKSRGRAKTTTRTSTRELPTLEACERALNEPASAWLARCYEISCKIVEAKLVDGDAVYGHWVGNVAPGSHFAGRTSTGFVRHGWILLKDGRVLDPTRWVFEDVEPYLYVGEPPDHWNVTPCVNCGLLKEEHRDGGSEDQCEMFEVEKWPYDEGGNQWREAVMYSEPKPVPKGPRKKVNLNRRAAAWVGQLLEEPNGTRLTANQLFYLANAPYTVLLGAVGPDGVKAIYNAICDLDDTSISWIPLDNANRARRECGFDRC